MPLLTLSRAAHLIGIPRATLQERIREGALPSFDGMVSSDDLLSLFPEVRLEDAGAFEKVVGIRDDAFAKRMRERVLPSQEILAQRLFIQGQELAELRRHLTRYHQLVVMLRERADREPALPAADLGRLIDEGLAEVLASPPPGAGQRALEAADAMLRVMSAHITVKPSGRDFFVEGSETLLKASLRAGLSPNYGCGNGNCGLCKARVVDGEVRQILNSDYHFSQLEKQRGYVLMCSCTAVSPDVVLEVLEADAAEDIPEQQVMTKVRSVDALPGGVIRLHLQTPRTNRLRFLAGQRVTLGMAKGGDTHGEFPLASCPCDDRNLLFHIAADDARPASVDFARRVAEGHLKSGDDVSVWGPWGSFILAKENGVVVRPLVFVAVGTGFAPINSLIEHAIAVDTAESMTLVWGATTEDGLYLANQGRAWAEALDGFRFHPVVSPALADELTRTVLALPALTASDVYLSGPAAEVDALGAALLTAGLPPGQLHAHSH